MTTFLLIRHGAHSLGAGIIAGRSDEAKLTDQGQLQSMRMADLVAELPIRAIYSSPVLRTRQTAQILSDRLRLPVQISPALAEIDFGQWSGKHHDDLRDQPEWLKWNSFRSGAAVPGGESMIAVQARIVQEMLRLAPLHPEHHIALVSHGDVIKSAAAYFLGVPLDLFMRIEISLASVTVIAVDRGGPWVLCVNNTGTLRNTP